MPIQQAVFEVRQRHRTRDDLLLLGGDLLALGARPHEVDAGIEQDRMGHACEWETSMMLRLAPHLVGDLTKVEPVPFGNAVRAGLAGLDHGDRSEPGHIGDPRGRPPRRARCCSASSPTTSCNLLERVLAWDGRSWDG